MRKLQNNKQKDDMLEEYQSIMKNDVWDMVLRTEWKSVVTSKWIYKIKHAADGSIKMYKARFVARSFSHKEGKFYNETCSLVAKYTSIRSIISVTFIMGWKLHQMDVKTTFLNVVIKEEVFIEQPQGFVIHWKESHVCRLKKYLYGLNQAPMTWYHRIGNYLMRLVFTKSKADPYIYYMVDDACPLILVLYVDDMFRTGDEKIIDGCKRELT